MTKLPFLILVILSLIVFACSDDKEVSTTPTSISNQTISITPMANTSNLYTPIPKVTEAINSNNVSIEQDGLLYYLATDKYLYENRDSIKIYFSIKNLENEQKNLGTVPNCKYGYHEFSITCDGEDIWHSLRTIPPCGFTDFMLDANSTWEYEDYWQMVNDNGTLSPLDDFEVDPSEYKVNARLWQKEPSVSLSFILEW